MLLLNYAHPLTAAQLADIAALLGAEPEVRAVPTRIDQALPLGPQVVALVDAAGLTPEQWQTMPLVVNPPGLAPAAVALIAELHGRTGHFPALLRLRPVAGAPATTYEVAEVLNLQVLRDAARDRR
jgi:hypothetical protein